MPTAYHTPDRKTEEAFVRLLRAGLLEAEVTAYAVKRRFDGVEYGLRDVRVIVDTCEPELDDSAEYQTGRWRCSVLIEVATDWAAAKGDAASEHDQTAGGIMDLLSTVNGDTLISVVPRMLNEVMADEDFEAVAETFSLGARTNRVDGSKLVTEQKCVLLMQVA